MKFGAAVCMQLSALQTFGPALEYARQSHFLNPHRKAVSYIMLALWERSCRLWCGPGLSDHLNTKTLCKPLIICSGASRKHANLHCFCTFICPLNGKADVSHLKPLIIHSKMLLHIWHKRPHLVFCISCINWKHVLFTFHIKRGNM